MCAYICIYIYTHTYLNIIDDAFYNKYQEENTWKYSDLCYKSEMSLNCTNFFLGNLVMWYMIWQVVNTWKIEKASIYFWNMAYGTKGQIEQKVNRAELSTKSLLLWTQTCHGCHIQLLEKLQHVTMCHPHHHLKRQPYKSTRSRVLNSQRDPWKWKKKATITWPVTENLLKDKLGVNVKPKDMT